MREERRVASWFPRAQESFSAVLKIKHLEKYEMIFKYKDDTTELSYHKAALLSLPGTAMDMLPMSWFVPAQIITARPSLTIEQKIVSVSSGISTAISIFLGAIL